MGEKVDVAKLMFYKSFMNEWLAFDPEPLSRTYYYSRDGVNFFELYRTGQGGGSFSFENPHPQFEWKGETRLSSDGTFVLSIEGKTDRPIFRLSEPPAHSINLVPLPMTRVIKRLYLLPDGQIFCWTGLKYEFTYETVCAYLGKLPNLTKIKVLDMNNLAITTSKGVFDPNRMTWEGYLAKSLDPKDFKFTETEVEIVITESKVNHG